MAWPEIFFKSRPQPVANTVTTPDKAAADVAPATKVESQVTLPGTGGKIFNVGTRPSTLKIASSPVKPIASVTSDMAEADALRAMTRVGGLRVIKRPTEPNPLVKTGPILSPGLSAVIHKVELPAAVEPPPAEPAKSAATSVEEPTVAAEKSPDAEVPKRSRLPLFFRRKAKMTDIAKIVLPPKSEESVPDSSSVIPPSFSVSGSTPAVAEKTVSASTDEKNIPVKEVEATEDIATPLPSEEKPKETTDKDESAFILKLDSKPESVPETGNDSSHESYTFIIPPTPKADEAPSSNAPDIEKISPSPEVAPIETPAKEATPIEVLPEPEAQKKEEPAKIEPSPAAAKPLAIERAPREFMLANGERILGSILSETPEVLYVEHKTLGVLTIPRTQIATRPIEIILINGDRIVGDLIAENLECLYVRHASLGMLTIPHTQRSTRVVEAILKDGDRILGEVLAENETATVIRSSTLGTISVPHAQVTMLNRKVEQVQLKALPPASSDGAAKSESPA